jgi:hypothetical protein
VKFRRGLNILFFAGLLGFFLACPVVASASLDDRDSAPAVVTGADTPRLVGTDPEAVVAFSWINSSWLQVPVQVDERKMIDFRPVRQLSFNADNEFRAMAYADPDTWAEADGMPQTVTFSPNRGSGAVIPGTTGDPTVDADDEIALMVAHAGDSAAGRKAPEGVDPATRTPVKVTDPLDPGHSRFIYLFRTTEGLDPSAESDYVSYKQTYSPSLAGGYRTGYNYGSIGDNSNGPPVNPEASTVVTPRYEIGIPGRWMIDRLVIAAGDGDLDILDGDKSTVSPTGCGRNELTFSRGGGGFIANIDGPVRAIRSFIGANSGTFTQREYVFYEGLFENRTFLRVHPGINQFVTAMDLSSDAIGMTYRNQMNPDGATIDGVQDSLVAGPFDWEQFSGAQGSITNVARFTTDIAGVVRGSYYQDMVIPATNSSMLCSGDDHSYGAAGPLITTPTNNTDPTLGPANRFESVRYSWFDGPEADADLAALRSLQVDSPLRVETGVAVDPRPEPEPKATLSVKVKPAKFTIRPGGKRRIAVVIRNRGNAAARNLRICLSRSRVIRFVPCQKASLLAAGGTKVRKFTVRPKRNAQPGLRQLRVTVAGSGRLWDAAKLKVRIRKR